MTRVHRSRSPLPPRVGGSGGRLVVLLVGLGVGAAVPGAARAAVCDSVAVPTLDCDADGWSPAQGDCDDADRDLSPSHPEVCADERDNDCDGFFDEECGAEVRLGTVRGGGGCTQQDQAPPGGGTIAFLLLPLPFLTERRRRSRCAVGRLAPMRAGARD